MKSHKQRQAELAAKRAARAERIARETRLRQLAAEEEARRRAGRADLPVDFAALRPNGSYAVPDFVARGAYLDRPFTCQTCGAAEVWTAARQKWWYEVAGGSTLSGPGGCRACRQRARAARLAAQAPRPPDPYRTPGQVLAAIHAALEPDLRAAGFHRLRRRGARPRYLHWAEHERGGATLTITLDRRHHRLTAELMTAAGADLVALAGVDFAMGPARTAVEARLAEFVAPVRAALVGMTSPPEGCLPPAAGALSPIGPVDSHREGMQP